MTPHFETNKSRIMNFFKNYNTYKDYYVKIYDGDIDFYFYAHYKEHIKTDENKDKYILFKIDIYFKDYFLVVGTEDKNDDSDLIFELERQKASEKELNCKFIKIVIDNDLDFDFEISCIYKFMNNFKDNKIKELENKIDKLKNENDFLKIG